MNGGKEVRRGRHVILLYESRNIFHGPLEPAAIRFIPTTGCKAIADNLVLILVELLKSTQGNIIEVIRRDVRPKFAQHFRDLFLKLPGHKIKDEGSLQH